MMVSNYRKIPRHMHRRNYRDNVTYTKLEKLTEVEDEPLGQRPTGPRRASGTRERDGERSVSADHPISKPDQ